MSDFHAFVSVPVAISFTIEDVAPLEDGFELLEDGVELLEDGFELVVEDEPLAEELPADGFALLPP